MVKPVGRPCLRTCRVWGREPGRYPSFTSWVVHSAMSKSGWAESPPDYLSAESSTNTLPHPPTPPRAHLYRSRKLPGQRSGWPSKFSAHIAKYLGFGYFGLCDTYKFRPTPWWARARVKGLRPDTLVLISNIPPLVWSGLNILTEYHSLSNL